MSTNRFMIQSKKIIKRLIPPIIIDIIWMVRVISHRNECRNVISEVNGERNAIIIGNGPSFNETLDKYLKVLQKNDCFMVNQSAISDYFEIVKPCYYTIMDPFYFVEKEKNINIPNLLNAFSNKLKWPMKIFVPYIERNSYIVQEFHKNPYITVVYLSSVAFCGVEHLYERKWFTYWNKNIMCPLAQTVLNTAVSIVITMRYKEIYLVGADTNWIEMLRIDQNNNDLILEERHFFDSERRILNKYNENSSNMAEQLADEKRAYEYYNILKKYAVFNGCQLYNASSYSLIDSLERRTLQE